MNYNIKPISHVYCTLMGLFFLFGATPASALGVSGGAMTINIDSTALTGAFTHNFDPSRPSFYLEEYFTAAQASSRTFLQIRDDHIIPGPLPIAGLGLQFDVNSSGNNVGNVNQNQDTNFSFDSSDLTGTAAGAIGLGGAMRFRLNKSFNIDPITGEETQNRAVTAFYSLEYDASKVDIAAGHSGWMMVNHHTFTADIFYLDNVITDLIGNTLSLSGDLALASGFNHLGAQHGAVIGDFSFQTTVVPVPAAIWLFFSAFVGLFATRKVANRSVV